MKRFFSPFLFILLLLAVPLSQPHAEEGMFPVTEIDKLPLQAWGFQISADQIFSEKHVSLSDAIVKLGGCTGSFISPDGLILTNHHCAYRAIQDASTTQNDYLADGFVAQTLADEYPAKGYTVRITQSSQDISERVLQSVKGIDDPLRLEKAIEEQIKKIEKEEEAKHPGLRAEVAEMFPGKTYYLFLYVYLKDVRLVYAPPSSVGNFGGDVDNWEWPRHTGDFSLMRAYVAPDGKPAEYSKDNIPFHPKTYLKIAKQGVEKGDRVFILGYPGRTYRHRTSYFLRFENDLHMPFVVEWYNYQIDLLKKLGQENPARALKFSSRIKGLANTEKNYRGKLQGIKRLHLIEQKQKQEQAILDFIRQDAKRRGKYGSVPPSIDSVYQAYRQNALREWILSYLTRSVDLPGIARTILKAASERQKPDLERESAFMDRNFERTKMYLIMRLRNFDAQADRIILKALLKKAKELPAAQKIEALNKIFKLDKNWAQTESIIHRAYAETRLGQIEYVKKLLNMRPEDLKKVNDPVLKWMRDLQPAYTALKEKRQRRSGQLRRLRALWLDVKKQYLQKDFIPDANGTFRFSTGKLEGYSPADAVFKTPITSVRGIFEKSTGKAPFNTPDALMVLLRKKQFGNFIIKTIGTLPIDILYSTDTTGGNSGSPVLNVKGQLVGLNFDRSFEATINDFAWNQSYSRSIGVDVRYLLFLLKDYAKANRLLREMGIGKTN